MFRIERLKPLRADEVPDGLLVISLDGYGLFEPAVSYIAQRSRPNGVSIGTLADDAYIICEWCNFLERLGVAWNRADESSFKQFISAGKSAQLGLQRQRRRISVVTSWYYFLGRKNIGGHSVKTLTAALTRTPLAADAPYPVPRYKVRRGSRNKNGKRNTPLDGDLDDILAALSSHKDNFIADRDFTLGATVIATGLRAMGLSSLTISLIDGILRNAKIIGRTDSVTWFYQQKLARDAIREALLARDRRTKKPMYGLITEKYGKVRQVSFTVQCLLLLLNHIWGSRYEMIRRKGFDQRQDSIWLSSRTGNPLHLGTVKDILKLRGFAAAGVEGSGHRLRASHLTMKAIELLRKSWEQNRAVDEPTILAQLALVAGHASIESLKPYLAEAVEILSRLQPSFQDHALSLHGRDRMQGRG